MKKITAILLSLFFVFGFAGCNGGTPEDGAEKVKIKYYAQAADMLPAMKTGQLKTGLLPEPAATKITTMNADVSVKIDVQEVYGGDYPQAVLVIKKSVAENDPGFAAALMAAIEENAAWITENDGNAASAVEAINSALDEGVTPSLDASAITKKVVENCNIYLEKSAAAKESVNAYLSAMKGVAADSAAALADGFFYTLPASPAAPAGENYKIYMPDGAPALAMAKLIKESQSFGGGADYTVVSASTIGQYVTKETADVAVLPVTAASKIIGSGEKYVMLGVVTHGNIYVMSSENVSALSDLRGKTVGVIGQGQVPDLTFRYLLNKNDISYEIAE